MKSKGIEFEFRKLLDTAPENQVAGFPIAERLRAGLDIMQLFRDCIGDYYAQEKTNRT